VKFQPDRIEGVNVITGYTSAGITVNVQPWDCSVIVPFQGEIQAWPCSRFDELAESHFEPLLALQPELVIVGSGRQHRFVPPVLVRALIAKGIGVESMDTQAACRTYNILAGESRRVVAALLLD
jgi:uncharacterized protein